MDEIRQDNQCIERRSLMDKTHYYSVAEYESRMRFARRIRGWRARAFHDLVWTDGAPPVEKLKLDWKETDEGKFRICDWDVYDAQIRELLGLVRAGSTSTRP